mgnify:CR=1 FL=1
MFTNQIYEAVYYRHHNPADNLNSPFDSYLYFTCPERNYLCNSDTGIYCTIMDFNVGGCYKFDFTTNQWEGKPPSKMTKILSPSVKFIEFFLYDWENVNLSCFVDREFKVHGKTISNSYLLINICIDEYIYFCKYDHISGKCIILSKVQLYNNNVNQMRLFDNVGMIHISQNKVIIYSGNEYCGRHRNRKYIYELDLDTGDVSDISPKRFGRTLLRHNNDTSYHELSKCVIAKDKGIIFMYDVIIECDESQEDEIIMYNYIEKTWKSLKISTYKRGYRKYFLLYIWGKLYIIYNEPRSKRIRRSCGNKYIMANINTETGNLTVVQTFDNILQSTPMMIKHIVRNKINKDTHYLLFFCVDGTIGKIKIGTDPYKNMQSKSIYVDIIINTID